MVKMMPAQMAQSAQTAVRKMRRKRVRRQSFVNMLLQVKTRTEAKVVFNTPYEAR